MKVTFNWLKQYTAFDWSPEQLAERLTMLGIEVEGVKKLSGEFEGIVVAQVITRDKHPNADKLSLCRVNDGTGERQIVCGAQNFKAGDKVPLILPGQTLPAREGVPPMTIKVGKIRGSESHGMLCSPQELGLPDAIDGLLILREDARVGQPFAEYLGRSAGDVVFDLEITPNRPDLNSVIGIAREIAALTGSPLKRPTIPELLSAKPSISESVAVRVEAPELCPRYVARLISGVKIGPSPDWLRAALEKVGMRSINNVVDVTNFVMLETGQPLHAFDFRLLSAKNGASATPTIVVRTANEGEAFDTLDGQKRTLTSQMLLIADESKAIALAGVMGGKNSEISNDTQDILIESAYFKPQGIRATSKKLELRTESSYRFERGGDIGICDWASRRAVQLIIETAGGKLAEGVIDTGSTSAPPKQILLRHSRTEALLGIKMDTEKQVELLSRLELTPLDKNGHNGATAFQIPTFRVDLKEEIDLIEEVVRLHGINNIPSVPPRGEMGSNVHEAIHDQISEARRLMTGLGLNEAQGQTLISDKAAKYALQDNSVPLANPLSSDMNILRPSLLPGLLDALRHNVSHRNTDISLFEIGRVFLRPPTASAGKPDAKIKPPAVVEERRLAISMTGLRQAPFWSGAGREDRLDIHDLKGILEEFFDQFGARAIAFHRRPQPTPLFVESAEVHLGKFVIGEIGQALPSIARQYDLRDPVFLAELNLDILIARRNPSRTFKALPNRPSVRRDVAMLLPENTTHEAVLQAVKQARPSNLEAVELFDIFRGQNVPAGQKSVAYAFTYRSPETNLTDAEVNATHEKLVAHFKQALQASIRDN